MEERAGRTNGNTFLDLLWMSLLMAALALTISHSYLLFHCLVEIFGIMVAGTIFVVGWNSRRFSENNYVLFVGIAYLFVGIIDLLHTLSYKGMGVFPSTGSNLATQLWIAARLMESFSLLAAPFFLRRNLNAAAALAGYAVVTAVVLASIFIWKVFPDCFLEGTGLTPFKISCEYLVCVMLLASAYVLHRNRGEFDPKVLRLIFIAVAMTILSEFCFTLYSDVYGILNMLGHLLKLASFYLIYKAIVVTGYTKPYSLLFRNLKQSERELQEARDHLEDLVAERTADLSRTNRQLRELSRMLINAQEDERARIAHDLHDELGQQLTAISMEIVWLEKQETLRPKNLESLETAIENINATLHRIYEGLRPLALEKLGPEAALRSLVWEYKNRAEFEITAAIAPEACDIGPEKAIILYRILQEALNNAARHSKAEHIGVSLRREGNTIVLEVKDNGRGFDMEKKAGKRGFGIIGMRERAAICGGSLETDSRPGGGTRITVRIPADNGKVN